LICATFQGGAKCAGTHPSNPQKWRTAMTQERHRIAHQLALRSRDLDSPWRTQASNLVQRRGDRLTKIYWKGRQWAATKFGVQCRDGSYSIDRRRLWEDEERGGWVMHMAEKDWVDLEDFAEALRVARFYERVRHHSLSEAAREGWRNR